MWAGVERLSHAAELRRLCEPRGKNRHLICEGSTTVMHVAMPHSSISVANLRGRLHRETRLNVARSAWRAFIWRSLPARILGEIIHTTDAGVCRRASCDAARLLSCMIAHGRSQGCCGANKRRR